MKFIPKWNEAQEARKKALFLLNSNTEVAFSEPLEFSRKFTPKWEKTRKAGKWFRFDLNVVQKSPFSIAVFCAPRIAQEIHLSLAPVPDGSNEFSRTHPLPRTS